ncbi:PIR protein [Plasmodium ovale]|uniref:PIR protein n=1 Tax=Plasmodium ovale TaxID=36330 RepID=A0A1D3JDM8_PLAOA|nr:PIR protein [Plasmodium ovale]
MPEISEDKVLDISKKTLWEKSNLFKFHKIFADVIKNGHETYKECENKNDSNLPDNCKIIEKIKGQWEEGVLKINPVTDKCKNCAYVLHWLYEKVKECDSNNFCISWLYKHFEKFWDSIYCGKKENNECDIKFEKAFKKDVLKNKKELYNFLEYYINIKNMLKDSVRERDLYCKYIQYIFNLYYFMVDEDEKRGHKKYTNELKLFEKSFQGDSDLSELKDACDNRNLLTKSQMQEKKLRLLLQTNVETLMPEKVNLSNYLESAPDNDILGETLTYKLYEEFDSDKNYVNDDEYCNKFDDLGNTYKSNSKTLCKKIVGNVKKFDTFNSDIKGDERCLHYKNWVYQKIWNIFISEKNHEDAGKAIDKFMVLQSDIVKNLQQKVCRYYFTVKNFMELHVKKEEKDLYEYFKYYNTIDNKISPGMSDEVKYRQYLTYIIKLYERRKNEWECCNKLYGVEPSCRHYFKCEEEYDPSDLLAILNGTSKDTIKKKYKKHLVVRIGERKDDEDINEDDILRIQFGRCSRIYDPDDNTKVISLRCDYKASTDHFGKFYNNLPDGKKRDTSKSIVRTETEPVGISDKENTSNIIKSESNIIESESKIIEGESKIIEGESNTLYFKITTSGALVLGTLFIFFLYYKFTPFGSLFRKGGRRKDRFEDDFHEEYMQQLPHDSEYEDIRPRNRRIQIAYQRA